MLAEDSLPPSRFRIRWQFRGLAALVGLGCLVGAGFAAVALFRGVVPDGSSNIAHTIITIVMLAVSYVFVRLAWTGSGRFLALLFDAETLRREARREREDRAQL